MSDNPSYATARKIRIIEKKYGPEWRLRYPNRKIDSIYNEVIGDTRKNLFCKIDSQIKDNLDEMVEFHKTSMSEFVEQLITAEYDRYLHNKKVQSQKFVEAVTS